MANKAVTDQKIDVTKATEAEPDQGIDVTQTTVKVKLPRARPGEENFVFVSDGRKNMQIARGVDVDVPYWAWDRLRQSAFSEEMAYKYDTQIQERAGMQP